MFGNGTRGFSLSAFAFVMATGIVARDGRLAGMTAIGWLLAWIAAGGYVVLVVLALQRIACHPQRMLEDLASHERGTSFLALVAATCVVGLEVAAINRYLASTVWLCGALLWLVLTYAFLTAIATSDRKPLGDRGLSGSWLLAVVATQSVSLLGAAVAPSFGAGEMLVLFVSISMFMCACFIYLALIPLIVRRLEFLPLSPVQFTADYWISMGAMAISALTGAVLLSSSARSLLIQELSPVLLGMTVFFWAGATWWIPLLIALQAWRHLRKHVPIVYEVTYWSAVFPIGMYAACTYALSDLVHLPGLSVVANLVAYVAVSLWVILFAGLAHHLAAAIRK